MRHSLYYQTKQKILELIEQRKVVNKDNQLISEEELSNLLEVSRTTVREALSSLTREGVISKKHGLGNFVHFSALQTKMRIDRTREFIDMLENAGYTARLKMDTASLCFETVSEAKTEKFKIESDQEILSFQCTYFADDRPAIYCKIHVLSSKLKMIPSPEIEKSIFDFLEKYCSERVAHTLVWFSAESCSEFLAETFSLEPGSPLIYWEEVYYNIHDEVVCFSDIYFNPEFMQICMLRKGEEY